MPGLARSGVTPTGVYRMRALATCGRPWRIMHDDGLDIEQLVMPVVASICQFQASMFVSRRAMLRGNRLAFAPLEGRGARATTANPELERAPLLLAEAAPTSAPPQGSPPKGGRLRRPRWTTMRWTTASSATDALPEGFRRRYLRTHTHMHTHSFPESCASLPSLVLSMGF